MKKIHSVVIGIGLYIGSGRLWSEKSTRPIISEL